MLSGPSWSGESNAYEKLRSPVFMGIGAIYRKRHDGLHNIVPRSLFTDLRVCFFMSFYEFSGKNGKYVEYNYLPA